MAKHIQPVVSPGTTCFHPDCEQVIPKGEGCVKITVKINLILTSTDREEFAHAACADKTAMELHSAAQEARSMTRRNQ